MSSVRLIISYGNHGIDKSSSPQNRLVALAEMGHKMLLVRGGQGGFHLVDPTREAQDTNPSFADKSRQSRRSRNHDVMQINQNIWCVESGGTEKCVITLITS
ncbi:hypothetical protein HCN58_18175 [Bradyrhizobium sp. WSM 1791]|uniref:Uncharacterized protein n=1 Tax=Bradyrhizobium australiense TaxID=2721161 RepID=A0A7Y4GTB4_9BRAD|nr:hypothetical protein [Bradyrhizobium australiense]